MLVSGAVHAAVNAAFKSGGDKMSSRALLDGFSGLLLLPAAFIAPLPTGAWSWLAASGAVHFVYLFALIKAFEGADMILAYPVLRGVAPVLTALGAVALFNEPMSWPVGRRRGAGLGRRADHRARPTHGPEHPGLGAADRGDDRAYTVVDAQGVRAAPTAPSYIVWSFVIDGGISAAASRSGAARCSSGRARRAQWRAGLLAGAGSIVSYGLALWALRLGATPRLAALRETSILFAVVIAIVFLKERASVARLAGVAVIGAGRQRVDSADQRPPSMTSSAPVT